MNRLPTIQKFLNEHARPELAAMFTEEMEVQVNVGVDGGTRVEKSFTAEDGREIKYWCYEKDRESWKHIRIPWNAKKEPSYIDKPLRFDVSHFEGIGLTGWNWVKRESHWVGFDFDAIANHKIGLTDDDLIHIRRTVESVDWVTVRRSTSGKGLHLYVFLDPPIETENHTEHAALARSILGILSARIGYRLDAKVDACGAVLWIWHRKQSGEGLSLIRQGTSLSDVPANWRRHNEVTSGSRKSLKLPCPDNDVDAAEDLINKTKATKLDEEHHALLGYLIQYAKMLYWWDADHNLLVCHTFDLQCAHKALCMRGPFYTLAEGKDVGRDQNAFAFPIRNGGWSVYRHTRRTTEHPSWTTTSTGWTKCNLNVPADIATACRCYGGSERSDGRFELPDLESTVRALYDLGAGQIDMPGLLQKRSSTLKKHTEGRALLSVIRSESDPPVPGWTISKNSKSWEKIIPIHTESSEIEVPDDFLRHVIKNKSGQGWYAYIRDNWIAENPDNIRLALRANGEKNVSEVMGQCVMHPWNIVNKPFQPEYPGGRQWNKDAPQFAFDERACAEATYDNLERDCPTWFSVLNHCGGGLTDSVLVHDWCKQYNVLTGGHYLYYWIAAMFQMPHLPLPYLFLYGQQATGKSTFHEALSLLFRNRVGVTRADQALTSQSGYNRELLGSVLCIVEETNLKMDRGAYNRIKDWVTSPTLLIHEKYFTPYEAENNTHWIQCSNEPDACPVLEGDTRITVIVVRKLEKMIGSREILRKMLEVEAPSFIYHVSNTTVPDSGDRLRVPVVSSAEKLEIAFFNELPVNQFFRECVFRVPGHVIQLDSLYAKFFEWLPVSQQRYWNRRKFYQQMPEDILRGKWKGSFMFAGNITFDQKAERLRPIVKIHDRLIEEPL